MKIFLKASALILVILSSSFLNVSCSSKFKFNKSAPDSSFQAAAGEAAETSDPSLMSEPSQEPEDIPPVNSASSTNKEKLIGSEIDGLSSVIAPYLDPGSAYYSGTENSEYLKNYLLKLSGYMEPMNANDWRKAIQILFFSGLDNDSWFSMYIDGFTLDEKIERQYALSGLMKLISTGYGISLGGDPESLKKSNELSDIDKLSDTHQILVRQAYCMGLTDITVDIDRVFRPNDYITRGEAASIFYRILSKQGLPVIQRAEEPVKEDFEKDPEPIVVSAEALTLKDMLNEYQTYKGGLIDAGSKDKLEQLLKAESILKINFDEGITVELLPIEKWQQILNEVFIIEANKIAPYLSYETGGTLPFDVAAISIFKLLGPYVGDPRDASQKEIEAARAAVPQIDSARDISKFAQMYSSGLLEGFFEAPGFTAQKPVSNIEAVLIVKRLIERR